MSQMEWILIIGAIIIPVIIFLFVFLKRGKKEKVAPATQTYVREDKPQQTQTENSAPIKEEKPKQVKPPVYMDTDDDFKSYLELRKKRIQSAEPKEPTSFVRSHAGEYIPARLRRQPVQQTDKSVAEQIQDLSPELKALIISGVLDKKF